MQTKNVLIVCDKDNHPYWDMVSIEIRKKIGPVDLVLDSYFTRKNLVQAQDVIVVDVSEIDTLHKVIKTIRQVQPSSRIIVISSTPTWKQTRELMRLGASNLVRKSADVEEMVGELQAV